MVFVLALVLNLILPEKMEIEKPAEVVE